MDYRQRRAHHRRRNVRGGATSRSGARPRDPPRVVNSPTLLTGLLACGACGAGMTLSTGKGGKYRYYTCNSRLNGGAEKCKSRSIPMDKLDRAVLASLAEKAFAPNRVRTLLATLKTRFQSGHSREAA